MPDPNATQSLQAFSFPTLDGRYLKWFQSHIADFQIIQQAGADAVEAFKRIWSDFPTGISMTVAESLPQEQVQSIQQEIADAGLQDVMYKLSEATPALEAIGERLGGGGLKALLDLIAMIGPKLPEILALIPQIKAIIDLITSLFPKTPVGGPATGGVVNPGFITQE